jgi:hypothetical protein
MMYQVYLAISRIQTHIVNGDILLYMIAVLSTVNDLDFLSLTLTIWNCAFSSVNCLRCTLCNSVLGILRIYKRNINLLLLDKTGKQILYD